MPDSEYQFISYLQFISDMLGGDIFPLKQGEFDIRNPICERAIDYSLIKRITTEIQKHNAVFHQHDTLEAYATLDALGAIRAWLFDHKGDINQISLVDRIGELTVSYFNLHATAQSPTAKAASSPATIHPIRKSRSC